MALDHEQLAVRRGERSGLYCVVAVHSTALGPALGGLRIWHYPASADAVRDAMRLAAGMTLKAAAAGLALGGGKGVICAPPGGLDGERRRAALLDFGDLVESLDGRYITAEDVGIVARRPGRRSASAPNTSPGCPPIAAAPATRARSRRSGSRRRSGPAPPSASAAPISPGARSASSDSATSEQGSRGASPTAAASCWSATSTRASARSPRCSARPGATRSTRPSPSATCSLRARSAARSTPTNVAELRCEIVCGSANNQLADDALAGVLAERGVLYAPDFVANAGGLIHVFMELEGYSEERARRAGARDRETVARVLAIAARARGHAADRGARARRRAARRGSAKLNRWTTLSVARLGLVPYAEGARIQAELERARLADEVGDLVLMLEHPPVYTKGRRSAAEELPMGEDWYRMQGIEIATADRGGQVTYHGPGQLVAYPIMSLRSLARPDDVHWFVRSMEEGDDRRDRRLRGRGPHARRADRGVGRQRPAAGRRRAQDRLDRDPRPQGGHHPRPRGQRRQRPAAVRVGGPVRDRGLPHDLADPRARRRAVGRRVRERPRYPAGCGLRPRAGGDPGGGVRSGH